MDDPQATGAESAETVLSEPTVATPDAAIGSDGGEGSFAEAFAAARAELDGSGAGERTGGQESQPAGDSGESPVAASDSDGQQEASQQGPRQYTLQGALDHISTLIAQGRENELSGEERGLYNRFSEQIEKTVTAKAIQQYEQDRADWEGLVTLARDMHRELEEDPEQFAMRVAEDPDLAQFYRDFKTRYPEALTGEQATYSREQYESAAATAREQGITEFRAALESSLETLAAANGVNYGDLRTKAGGKVGTLLEQVFTAAVDAKAAAKADSMRESIRSEERTAAQQEAAAKYANQTIVVPRPINGTGIHSESTGPISIRDAFREAQAELAKTR